METKLCRSCDVEKPLTEFSNNKTMPDGKQRYCKKCHSEYDKQFYYRYREKNVERSVKNTKIKYQKFADYKKTCKCAKCGETRYYVLEFHHVDPSQKEGDVNSLLRNSFKKAMEEIEKCVTLCANCHREFHHLQRNEGIEFKDYIK